MEEQRREIAAEVAGRCEGGGPLRLTLDLPEGAAYVPSLRRTARCLLESVGVPHKDVEDIELVLGELATNAVMHSHSDEGYRVEVELTTDVVRVTVTDRGTGFPAGPLAAPGTLRSPSPEIPTLGGGEAMPDPFEQRFGGWGLPLVQRLADHVEILPNSPHGTTVRAEKRLRLERLPPN